MSLSRVLVLLNQSETAESFSDALLCRGFSPHALQGAVAGRVVFDLGLPVLEGWKATAHVEPSDLPNRACVVSARADGFHLMEPIAPNGLSTALRILAN